MPHKNVSRLLAVSASALCVAMAWQTVLPQSASAQVEELVVQARKRAESVQDVPITMTTLDGTMLKQQNISGLDDIQNITPNFKISQNAGGGSSGVFQVRGQANNDFGATLDSTVGVYIDGVYRGRPLGLLANNLIDVERIEVLKGPQGTLYGRNTTGGAVSIFSREPVYDFQGTASLRIGNEGKKDVEGVLNVPVVEDVLAVRLVGQSLSHEGYGVSSVTGQDLSSQQAESLRGSILFEPNDWIKAKVVGDFLTQENDGLISKLQAVVPTLVGGGPTNVSQAVVQAAIESTGGAVLATPLLIVPTGLAALTPFVGGDPFVADINGLSVTHANMGSYDADDQWGVLGDITFDFEGFDLRSITAYREQQNLVSRDLDGSPFRILQVDSLGDQNQLSQEFQFLGTAFEDRLDWIVGLFYFKEEVGGNTSTFATPDIVLPLAALPPGFPPGTNVGDLIGVSESLSQAENESYAVFAQGTYDLTARVSVTGGLRYTKDEKTLEVSDFNNPISGPFAGATICTLTPAQITIAPCTAGASRDYDAWSWAFGADFKATDDMLLFAKVSRGFRSGGLNTRDKGDAVLAPFDSETVTDYEIGIKSDWWDGRLRANAAAFYSDYEDIQRATNFVINSRLTRLTSNAAKGNITGFEADVILAPIERLTLQGTFGWIDAEYDEFDDLSAAGLPISRVGEAFQYTPEISYTLGATYEATLPNGGDMVFHLDWSWVDEVNYNREFPGEVEPSYGLLNGRVSFSPFEDDRFEVALFGRNLTDEEYNIGRLSLLDNLGTSVGFTAPPRVWGVELTAAFGGY